ncbi:MAG: helicase associated domain-containing protein [Chlamydiota bacterium]
MPGWSWRVFDDRNNQGFEALDSFVKREGHALVPTGHIENGFNLGRWVSQKRLAYQNPNSKNKLTKENIEKFESSPWWFWNGDEGRWEWGKHFLLKFIDREGHSRVKHSHIEDGFELGRWIGIWKSLYNKKNLPQWKIDFFRALPQWSWDVKADRWYEGFNILKGYVQREGHASVPAKHVEGSFKLGVWMRTQKYSYIKQSYGKKLSQEKINLLESLAEWSWDNQIEESWNEGYEALMKFVKINGHGDVPARHVMEGFELGTWVSGQRYSFKEKRLPPERIALLEKIHGWVWKGSRQKPTSTSTILESPFG